MHPWLQIESGPRAGASGLADRPAKVSSATPAARAIALLRSGIPAGIGRRLGWLAGLALALSAAGTARAQPERVVFGGVSAYPPFEWLDGEVPRGFNVELERAIAEAGGVAHEHRLDVWTRTYRALESGDIDAVAMYYSEERAESFLFTPPFRFIEHNIYAKEGSPHVSSVEELIGHRVAVDEQSYAYQTLVGLGLPIDLVMRQSTLTALNAVLDGSAEYSILAAPTANYLIHRERLPLVSVSLPFWPRSYAFAVSKDRIELAEWLTQQLYEVLRNGEFEQIDERWEEEFERTPETGLMRALRIALVPFLVLGLAGAGWAWRLRRAMNAHTHLLSEELERRRSAESRARWVANHHLDTDLPRQSLFSRRVSQLLSRAARDGDLAERQIVAIKPTDLDKRIRALGHKAGVAALREFAQHLRSMSFAALGQTGRDVFLVFGDREQIDSMLRGIVSVNDTLVLSTESLPRFYGGSSTWPKDGRSVGDLLRRAETALAVAVEKRQAWVDYRPSMEPDEEDLKLLELFQGTAGEGLHAAYQPQIDLRTGQLVGAEALVRWDAKGFGAVPPDRFIPLLEDAGLIRHVTSRMVREAIRVGSELRREGHACPISVNISITDLLGDKLQKTIIEGLETHGGSPADLKLEITETTVAEQSEEVKGLISRFRDMGIGISIDDFGTGYSSLAYLSDFPVAELKIDRSFVIGMPRKPQDRSIVRSTIAMAHELDMCVVAEGIETEAQLAMLRQLDCDRAQGYLISEPLREKDFVALVTEVRTDGRAWRLSD